MISRLSENIMHALERNGEIKEEDRELFIYGLTQGIRMCLNVLTTLLIGLLMGMWWQGLLFLAAFIPTRSFAGGYHAKTPLRCYWCSVGIVIAALTVVRNGRDIQIILNTVAILSVAVILYLAPVESENKPLSEPEKKSFKKKTQISLFIALFCMAVFSMVGMREASRCIKTAVGVVGLLVLAGGLKNSHDKHSSMRG